MRAYLISRRRGLAQERKNWAGKISLQQTGIEHGSEEQAAQLRAIASQTGRSFDTLERIPLDAPPSRVISEVLQHHGRSWTDGRER